MAKLEWHGALAEKKVRQAGMEGMYLGAEAILTESHSEVPHESGTLMRSGIVTEAPEEKSVYVSYNTPYAVKQHEDLSLRHTDGRKAKYLEGPFKRMSPQVIKLVEKKISQALGKG